MSDATQPFYYHMDDKLKLDKLIVSVALRKIVQEKNQIPAISQQHHASIVIGEQQQEEHTKNNINETLLLVEDEPSQSLNIRCDIAWQEKLNSPKEILSKNNINIVKQTSSNEDIHNENDTNNNDNTQEIQDKMRIFTYTHKEIIFATTLSNDAKRINNNKKAKNINLQEVSSFISPLLIKKTHNSTQRQNVFESKGIPYRMMFIMAAVDCEVRNNNKTHYGVVNNHIDKHLIDYHEELLCRLKAYDNGVLEVTPGFSVEEDEDEYYFKTFFNNNKKAVESNRRKKDKIPNRLLTTFRFSTAKGNVFEYSLVNKNTMKDFNDIERICNEEDFADQCILSERSQYYKLLATSSSSTIPTTLYPSNKNNSSRPSIMLISAEIISADNFDVQANVIGEQSYIYVNHDVTLPRGWTLASCDEPPHHVGISDDNNHTARKKGRTPLAALPSSYLIQEFRMDEINIIAALTIPLALVLICFFESIVAKTAWVVPLAIALVGTGIPQRDRINIAVDVCHFNHPINLYLQPPDTKSDDEWYTSITIAFEVCSQKLCGSTTIEGYAFLNIPTTIKEGSYFHKVKTWKDKGGGVFGNIRNNMFEYYLGGSAVMSPLNEVLQSYQQNKSKLGHITESQGNLSLHLNITRERSVVRKQSNFSNISDFTNDIDNVLTRVRRNRTERKIREIAKNRDSDDLSSLLNITTSNNYLPTVASATATNSVTGSSYNNISSSYGSASIISTTSAKSQRTAEILSRIKTREEARNKSLYLENDWP